MPKSYEQAIATLLDKADLNEKKAIINRIVDTDRNLMESLSITWLNNSKMLVGGVGKCQAYFPIGIYVEGWFFPTNNYDTIEIFSGDKFITYAITGESRLDVYKNFRFFNEKNAGFYCLITKNLETIEKNGQITILIKKDGKTIKKIKQSIVCNSVQNSIEEIKKNLHEKNNIIVPTLTNQLKRLSVIARQLPEYNFVTLIEGMQNSLEEVERFCLDDGLSKQELDAFFLAMVPDILRRNNAPRHSEIYLDQAQMAEYGENDLICQAAKNFQTKYNVSKEYSIRFCMESISYSRQLIGIIKPKMILIWNKFSPWHIMLELVAKESSVPVVYMESGVLPGTLIFETEGQMGESYPATHSDEFCKLKVNEEDVNNAEIIWNKLNENKLNRWISSDASVYNDEELEKVKEQLNPEWPTILYAGQNDFESGLYPYTEHTRRFHSPIFESSEEVAIYLGKLAKKNNWNLIYKRHPMMRGKLVAELPGNIIVNDTINIHDAIDISDLVITILSQTSYVSLIRRKPALMLGYHQLNHKGCIYETNEKDKIESKILEALDKGFTDTQKENFKKHIAQLCKYYLYRDFTNHDISYGKNIDDLGSWLNEVMTDCAQPVMPSRKVEVVEAKNSEKEFEAGRFTLDLSLRERIIRRKLKASLSDYNKISSMIYNSVSENKYEDTMMFISQIDSNYLEDKEWKMIFSKICQSFIYDSHEAFEAFLSLNKGLNEEVKKRLVIDTLIQNTVKTQIEEKRVASIARAFNTRYTYSQKLFLEELSYYISDLISKKEVNTLYDLIDEWKSDDAGVNYIMELIFQNNYFDSELMKKWMKILLNSSNVEMLYYFGVNELDLIRFVYPECVYGDYYTDRNQLLKKISEILNADKKWEKTKKEDDDRTLGMIVIGLHGKNYASTRLQVGLANKLNEDGWKVTIYVADINYISTNKKFVVNPSSIRRNFSKEIYQRDHWGLVDVGVEVKYFNQQEDDIDRYHRLIKSVYEDNPQAIIDITNEQAIYNIQLIKDFPVISVPLNGYTTSSTTSCYIARNLDYVHRLEDVYGKIDAEKMTEANLYLPYPIDREKYERRNYRFTENDILIVTVGNRLDYEVTSELQEKMKLLLSENHKLRWLIVGKANENNFVELKDEIQSKQVILWGYEEHLYKLYRMCDIYLDLPRSGGGGSTALAVQCGLPAVIVKCFSDILPFLGEENAVEDFDGSLDLLRELAKSKVRRRQMNKAEYQRLMSGKFSMKNFANVIQNEILEWI